MPLLYPVTGIDVSFYQREIDWNKAASKISFAMIKASQSTVAMDSQFLRNWQEAKARGIPRGAYHYFVPRSQPINDPKLQAENFARVLGDDLGEIPPWMDCESDPDNLDIAAMWERIGKFLKRFEELTGIDCGIYTRASWWDPQVTNGEKSATDFPRIYNHGMRPLWVAHYNQVVQNPSIPWDWERRYSPTCWDFWQYTEDKTAGPEYGVQSAGIDLNRWNGSVAEFEAEYNVTIPPVEPDPDEPEPEPDECGMWFEVISDTLNVRAGPGTSYAIVDKLAHGDIVQALHISGQDVWIQIDTGASVQGWCAVRYQGKPLAKEVE